MIDEFNDLLGQIQRLIKANNETLLGLERATVETEKGLGIKVDEVAFSPGEMAIPSFMLTGNGIFNTEINIKNISVSRVKLEIGSCYKPHFHPNTTEVAIVIRGKMEEKTTSTIIDTGGTILTEQNKVHNYEALLDTEYIVVYVKNSN